MTPSKGPSKPIKPPKVDSKAEEDAETPKMRTPSQKQVSQKLYPGLKK